jgi:TM2 domain-containing membrane protein YozV
MYEIITRIESSKRQKPIAIILAIVSVVLPIPIAGLHKFYLRQYLWGIVYLALWSTPIPKIACAIDAIWYLLQDSKSFDAYYSSITSTDLAPSTEQMKLEHVQATTLALENLEQLRQQGLVSEMEFEQKRRQLLEKL